VVAATNAAILVRAMVRNISRLYRRIGLATFYRLIRRSQGPG
jgi:hypothetical protein